jgi:hypothetical protein
MAYLAEFARIGLSESEAKKQGIEWGFAQRREARDIGIRCLPES